MAGQSERAVPFASEGLEIARRLGTPIGIAQNVAALAGALVDRDPGHARGLLEESMVLRSVIGFESSVFSTPTTLMAAKTRDWGLTLETAEHAIRHLHWGGAASVAVRDFQRRRSGHRRTRRSECRHAPRCGPEPRG
jgi:hypothetical protein